MRKVRAGLIGYGGIVRKVLDELPRISEDRVDVTGILVRKGRSEAARGVIGSELDVFEELDQLLATRPHIIAECAGHSAVDQYGEQILKAGIDLMVVSIGSLSDPQRYDRLYAAAREGDAHIVLPAGAIGAVDALAAAKIGGLSTVKYRSRKPPEAWKGTPAEEVCDLDNLKEAYTFYRGKAREASLLFPKNANVAATVALAGLGFDRTDVELCADPNVAGNVHEIEAEGVAGSFRIELLGKPIPENIRTSMLTAFSVARGLANLAATTVI
ncbi:MAG: aspartate dehydrogenase [Proteobacteria bacterium]|nr:aspartate dehydrogenase [Pseudomonadota bacterium]